MLHHRLLISIFLLISTVRSNGQSISLEDIWLNGTYRAEYYSSFNWTADGQHYTAMTTKEGKSYPVINLFHVKNGLEKELTILMPEASLPNASFTDYSLSPDQSKILFTSGKESVYRRSYVANFYIFDIKAGSLLPLHDFDKGKISEPVFSPKGDKIAFVRKNNLYITDINSLKERAITADGKFNSIINGLCDWVYEEEFEFTKAFFWSPDSKKIAYYRFDETNVKEYNLQIWGDIYPKDYRYKYPKAGEENSKVSLLCTFVEDQKTIEIDASIPGEREYFPRLCWTGDPSVISYSRMNRLQNNLEIIHYNIEKKKSVVSYKETDAAYVEINDNRFYLSNTEDFIFSSEKSGFRHIYFYQKSTHTVMPLTQGEFEITEIAGIDEKKNLIYFTSQENSPLERQLYSVDISGKGEKQLTKTKGVHDVSFSPGCTYYMDNYSNATTPSSLYLVETTTGTLLKTIGSNEKLKTKLSKTTTRPPVFFKFTTTQKNALNGWIIKPVNFDTTKKYPVLVTIYGGPGSQEVTDRWHGQNYLWYQMLAQKGYAIVCIDGRGTGGRGAAFKKITQLNLGKYETEDLIETAKYLQQLEYIDSSRIGIFGWSFGGYLASLAITKGAGYFKTAIAVAPVTNWRYYDNIYTERYMGLPQTNGKGYDENAPAYFAKMLKGNYLLIHGTADDNVHVQNSIEMQRALITANKQFDVFYYPDKNHSIYGGTTRYHLYKKMTDFILEKL
ncbi:MAG TPA: S9 family peptidase [Cytophagaceae bacterium]|jgi:dipeptidyl-peptidase-4|nr:S9 family peptidase [Cytophagaceae bacterium]